MNHHPSIAQPQQRHIAFEINPSRMPRKRHYRDIVSNSAPRHFVVRSFLTHHSLLPMLFVRSFFHPVNHLAIERHLNGNVRVGFISADELYNVTVPRSTSTAYPPTRTFVTFLRHALRVQRFRSVV